MMKCTHAARLFSACWDDELSLIEREALQQHFDACPACRTEYDRLAATMELVQGLPRNEAPEGFVDAVMARVRVAEPVASDSWWQRAWAVIAGWQESAAWRPALATGAAAVMVVAVLANWPQESRRPSSPSISPRVSDQIASDVEAQSRDEPIDQRSDSNESARFRDDMALSGAVSPRQGGASRTLVDADRKIEVKKVAAKEESIAPLVQEPSLLARAEEDYPIVPDSLFDHAYDIEFALDPVNLRPVPGDSGLSPMNPMSETRVGRRASIHF